MEIYSAWKGQHILATGAKDRSIYIVANMTILNGNEIHMSEKVFGQPQHELEGFFKVHSAALG